MRSAEFSDIKEAAAHRKQNGGWLFVVGATNAWWFDAASYTASSVMTSRQCKGLSGELVCDNRYLEATDGAIPSDMCKADAVILAHNMAHKNQEPAYAIETKWGWTCATRKPSLRYGKVIECHNGKECHA